MRFGGERREKHIAFLLGAFLTLVVLRLTENDSAALAPLATSGGAASIGDAGLEIDDAVPSNSPSSVALSSMMPLASFTGTPGDPASRVTQSPSTTTAKHSNDNTIEGEDDVYSGPPVPTPIRGEGVELDTYEEDQGGNAINDETKTAPGTADERAGTSDGAEQQEAAAEVETSPALPSPPASSDPVPLPHHSQVCVHLKPSSGARFDPWPVHKKDEKGKTPFFSRDVSKAAIADYWNISHCYTPVAGGAASVQIAEGQEGAGLRGLRKVGMSGKVVLNRLGLRGAGSRHRGPGREKLLVPSYCDRVPEFSFPLSYADTFESLLFSRSETTMRYGRSAAGPDEVSVELEGPELLSLPPVFDSRTCSYTFYYSLSLPGRYRLRIMAYRGGYQGLEEVSGRYPETSFDNIGGDGLFMLAVDDGQQGEGGTAGPQAGALSRSIIEDAWRRMTQRELQSLPLCRSRGAFPSGRWVASSPPSQLMRVPSSDSPYTFKRRIALKPEYQRQWWTDPGRYSWLPYSCRAPPRPRLEAARKCFAGKRVLISGDSHDRGLFMTLAGHLWGLPPSDTLPKLFHSTRCYGNSGKEWGELEQQALAVDSEAARKDAAQARRLPPQLCFVWNSLGDPAAVNLLGGHWDAVLFGFGHHPANGNNRWSLDRWKSAVARLFRTFASALKVLRARQRHDPTLWRAPSLLYHTIPAAPIRKDGQPRQYGDGRTLQRLRAMNGLAAEAMGEAFAALEEEDGEAAPPPITVLDLWSMTLPLIDLSADSVHYDEHPPYAQATLDLLLQAVCAVGGADNGGGQEG